MSTWLQLQSTSGFGTVKVGHRLAGKSRKLCTWLIVGWTSIKRRDGLRLFSRQWTRQPRAKSLTSLFFWALHGSEMDCMSGFYLTSGSRKEKVSGRTFPKLKFQMSYHNTSTEKVIPAASRRPAHCGSFTIEFDGTMKKRS